MPASKRIPVCFTYLRHCGMQFKKPIKVNWKYQNSHFPPLGWDPKSGGENCSVTAPTRQLWQHLHLREAATHTSYRLTVVVSSLKAQPYHFKLGGFAAPTLSPVRWDGVWRVVDKEDVSTLHGIDKLLLTYLHSSTVQNATNCLYKNCSKWRLTVWMHAK